MEAAAAAKSAAVASEEAVKDESRKAGAAVVNRLSRPSIVAKSRAYEKERKSMKDRALAQASVKG